VKPEVAAIGDAVADALASEWGQFVAVEPIFVGGVRAHNVGDAVPAANVAAHGWEAAGLVRRR
jgi:hypothetical protein